MTKLKIDELIKISIIFLIFVSYFAGFNLRENLAGGAEEDFLQFTWPALKGLENNLSYSLLNYGMFHEGSWPMFHLLNAFLNPFTYSELAFQLSITIISILNVFLFQRIIVKKYNLSFIDAFFISSILLLLPFFRSSAFWGLTENFGWLFLLLSINIYITIPAKTQKLSINIILKIFLTSLFSALALYTRQYLVFFSAFVVISSLLDKKFNHFILYVIFFSILSIPSLVLIKIWGGLADAKNFDSDWFGARHSPLNIIKNIPIFFSYFLFYLFPFLFIQDKFFSTTKEIKEKSIIFILCFLVFMIIYLVGYFDYLKEITLGGGVFIKLNKLLFGDNLIFFLFISSLGLTFIISLVRLYPKNIVILVTLLIYCIPQYFFQEYVEPLILLIFLFLMKNKYNFFEKDVKNYTLYFVQIYFISNLAFTYFYRNLL
jgi:hypothetical protein